MINITINNHKIKTNAGKTILEVANDNGIYIPTLCHDKELNPFGSCWVCSVEVKGIKGFVTACGTEVKDGMIINTESESVINARKIALQLLASDHYADCEAPCKIACPDHVDIQTYVALIANGQFDEAVKVIKSKLPLPQSIGRVCPAFCEHECRRTIVDEPIAIRHLKRYASDVDAEKWKYNPKPKKSKGKKIAVIGAGPSGLSCAYYSAIEGYKVTVFEEMEKPGGWLQYGIPEYRLPKKVLQDEIKNLCSVGIELKTNVKLGRDIMLSALQKEYDAVYLGIGATLSVPMKVKGSDLKGAMLGADFLKNKALNKNIELGKKVAIIGGGNTAVDCARTCIRLGSDVTIIYRRTRNEMPAEKYEIDAAELEGVKFKLLTNPVEYIGEDGVLKEIKLEKMILGKPDSSGRKRPESTGEFVLESYDNVISAISQKPDINFLSQEKNKINNKEIPLTKWDTVIVNEENMYCMNNIFAGGDFRRGPATAIEAIADGRVAAESIDNYLLNKPLSQNKFIFDSKKGKKLKDISPEEYSWYEPQKRVEIKELNPVKRANIFEEVELSYLKSEAITEAKRCLECGCLVNNSCKLRDYCTEYEIDIERITGDINKHPIDDSHLFILRDSNKCIKCGRCVRICSEVQGAGVLGYLYRGFKSDVAPELGESLSNTSCEVCGKCIEVCPVGALTPKNINYKIYPSWEKNITQNCGNCGTNCLIDVVTNQNNIKFIQTPDKKGFNDRNLCFKGRFGWQIYNNDRIEFPILNGMEADWDKIVPILKEKLEKLEKKQIIIGADITNEEILSLKVVASRIGAEIFHYTKIIDFSQQIIKGFENNVNVESFNNADTFVIIGEISNTVRTLVRSRQKKGANLVIIDDKKTNFNEFTDNIFIDKDIEKSFKDYIDNFSDKTSKTIYIYNREFISDSLVKKIWEESVLHSDFSNNFGVLPLSDFTNKNGLNFFDIKNDNAINADFLLTYGLDFDNFNKIINNTRFVVAVESFLSENCKANIILPKPNYLEISGSSISDINILSKFKNIKNKKYFDSFLLTISQLGYLDNNEINPEYWQNKVNDLIDGKKDKLTKDIIIEKISKMKINECLNFGLNSLKNKKIKNLLSQK